MALYEQIRTALGDYMPDDGEELKLKISPQGTSIQTAPSQVAGGPAAASGGTATPAPTSPAAAESAVPQAQRLTRNPQLAGVPGNATVDDIFEAQLAELRQGTTNQYLDILQQLGFVDESGAFVPGLVETAAARRRADLGFGQERAREAVTGEAQRGGTLFSGRRAERQAQAEHPFVTDQARLESDVPLELGKLFQSATSLIQGFQVQMNRLLAEAGARAAERVRSQPVGTAPAGVASEDQAQSAAAPQPAGGSFEPQPSFLGAPGGFEELPYGYIPRPGQTIAR